MQRSFFDRVWHQEEERAIYDLFDGEASGIDPVQGVNPDTYRPWYRGMLRHLGGVRVDIVQFLEQEDRMALKFVLRGTARKSGGPVVWKGSGFGRYAGGKIVGGSNYLDHLSLFSQLDLLPEQAMQDALADESLFWEIEQAARRADEQGQRPDPWLIRCGVARPARSIFVMPGPDLTIPEPARFEAAVQSLLPGVQSDWERFAVPPAPLCQLDLPEDDPLEILLRAYAGAMVVVDAQDRIVEMNPAFSEFAPGGLVSYRGSAFSDLLESEDQNEENRLFRALCTGGISRYERSSRLRTQPIPLTILATRIDRGGQPPLVVRCLRGRSQSVAADLLTVQELERSLLLDRLQRKLAHELAELWGHLQSLPEPTEHSVEGQLHERCLALVERMARDSSGSSLDSPEAALGGALAQLLEEYRREDGLCVGLELDPELAFLSGVTALFVYRIVQEALRNVVRHGGVQQADVRLVLDTGHLHGTISDRGLGFDPSKHSGGLGLAGMKERCTLLRGNLAITSQPGQGTRIDFHLPPT